jgi:hypothetical protein
METIEIEIHESQCSKCSVQCGHWNKVNTMQSKERARCGRQRHLQSDRLGSMAGSQETAGLRGGARAATRRGRSYPLLEGRASTEEQGWSASPRWPLADVLASVKRAERARR